MLDVLLGRGFASKCKSLIKLTKSRIDVIRRKRNAMQKFLKKDMADLLANGLDVNAYGRAEGLLVELTLSSCYDFVEQCCDLLLKHLLIMQKQSECPKECREAISSLMFAAAGFSDLPELRDLRHTFQERYGNSLDHCLNQEFSEKLAPKPFALEKKVRLMQDIASEFSIDWNPRNFEQQMSKASNGEKEHLKGDGFYHVTDGNYKVHNNGKEVPPRGDHLNFHAVEASNNGKRFRKRQETGISKKHELDLPAGRNLSGDNLEVLHAREVPLLRNSGSPRQQKQDFFSDRIGKESPDPTIMRPDTTSRRKGDGYADNGTKHSRARAKSVPEREIPMQLRQGSADKFPPTSLMGEAKVTSSTCNYGGLDQNGANHNGTHSVARAKSERHRSYADNFAATSLKSEVKVTSFVHNNGVGDHNNAVARVLSEGDKPYAENFAAASSKNEVKVASFVRNNVGGNLNITNSMARVKSEGDRLHFNHALPPPYVKPNVMAKDVAYRIKPEIDHADPNSNGKPKSSPVHKTANGDQRIEDIQMGMHYLEKVKEDVGPGKGNGRADGKDYYKNLDDANGIALTKARSSRRRHSKSQSAQYEARDHDEDVRGGKRSSRSRRRDDPRRGLQIWFDDEQSQKDEEERIIDKLLIHYSNKSSNYEGGRRAKRKSGSRHHNGAGPDMGESPLGRQVDKERPDEEFGVVPPPRSVSLPHKQPSAPPEPAKVFTRAATFQIDRSDAAKHVHPKLPDYDDLAARFAALRGR